MSSSQPEQQHLDVFQFISPFAPPPHQQHPAKQSPSICPSITMSLFLTSTSSAFRRSVRRTTPSALAALHLPAAAQSSLASTPSALTTAAGRTRQFSQAGRPPRCDPSLVVFDKDGTLIDFNLMWGGWVESQAWKVEMTTNLPVREKLFDAMGYDWIRRSIRSKGALCCTPMGELYKLAVRVLVTEGMTQEKAEAVIKQCWSMPDPVTTSRPLADIGALFRTIKHMGMKIAVCTTDDRQPTIDTLKHLQLDHMVDALACGDDGLPAKPAAEQIWTICQTLGVQPHNTIMVGDTSTDMLLGKNAGCGLSIGVIGGASSLEDLAQDADILVPSIDKVTKVLFQYGQQARRHGDITE